MTFEILWLSILYFFARNSVGKGSVPQIILKYGNMNEENVALQNEFNLEEVLIEIFLLLYSWTKSFKNNITEIRKINEAFSENF